MSLVLSCVLSTHNKRILYCMLIKMTCAGQRAVCLACLLGIHNSFIPRKARNASVRRGIQLGLYGAGDPTLTQLVEDGDDWLRLPQSVDFMVAVLSFRVLHGLTPPYLNQLARVAALPRRRRLQSASSNQLLVQPFQLTTVGRRTFPVAASLLWNSLPFDIQASSSLSAFRQRLQTFFRQSFPDIVL